MADIIFTSQPLLQGYFCGQEISVVEVEMEVFEVNTWKKKKVSKRVVIIYFSWFLIQQKMPRELTTYFLQVTQIQRLNWR